MIQVWAEYNFDLLIHGFDLNQIKLLDISFSQDNGLEEILKLYNDQHQQLAKKELQTLLSDSLSEGRPLRDIVAEIKEMAQKENIQEHETVCIIWTTVMDMPEWSKKEVSGTDECWSLLLQRFPVSEFTCIWRKALLEDIK